MRSLCDVSRACALRWAPGFLTESMHAACISADWSRSVQHDDYGESDGKIWNDLVLEMCLCGHDVLLYWCHHVEVPTTSCGRCIGAL